MNESEKQFSLTRAALSTCGRAKNQILISEIGEDAIRVLNDIIPLQADILVDVAAELPHLRQAAKWASRLLRL